MSVRNVDRMIGCVVVVPVFGSIPGVSLISRTASTTHF